jgi:hypothetical protein
MPAFQPLLNHPMPAERLEQERGLGPLRRGVRGVEHRHAERGQPLGQQSGAAPCNRRPRPVVAPDGGDDLLAVVPVRKGFFKSGEEFLDLRAQKLPVHGEHWGFGRPFPQGAADRRAIARQPRHRSCLSEVVVVACHPEDRDHRTRPALLQNPRQRGGGDCLVDGEETRLLASGDGKCPRLQETRRRAVRAGRLNESLKQFFPHAAGPGGWKGEGGRGQP